MQPEDYDEHLDSIQSEFEESSLVDGFDDSAEEASDFLNHTHNADFILSDLISSGRRTLKNSRRVAETILSAEEDISIFKRVCQQILPTSAHEDMPYSYQDYHNVNLQSLPMQLENIDTMGDVHAQGSAYLRFSALARVGFLPSYAGELVQEGRPVNSRMESINIWLLDCLQSSVMNVMMCRRIYLEHWYRYFEGLDIPEHVWHHLVFKCWNLDMEDFSVVMGTRSVSYISAQAPTLQHGYSYTHGYRAEF